MYTSTSTELDRTCMQEIAQEGLQSSVNIVDNGNREEAYNLKA